MAVLTPHFDLPFRFGGFVEQGSARDVANCVYMICAVPLGYRDEAPNFGIDNVAFDTPPVMNNTVRSSIRRQEPRADIIFTETEGEDQLERIVKVANEVRRNLV